MHFGHAGRHHHGVDFGAVVLHAQSQWVFNRHVIRAALHLCGEWLAVDGASNHHIVQTRIATNIIALLADFNSARARFAFYFRDIDGCVDVFASGVQRDHHIVAARLHGIAGQLAGNTCGAFA